MKPKHDYAAAIKQMRGFIEDGQNIELDLVCLHALIMMQKLQEPSEGMIRAMLVADNYRVGVQSFKNVLKVAIEQAEKEIEG